MNIKYPYTKQNILKSDIDKVTKSLKADFITQGQEIELFEKELCKVFKCKYAVVVNSGTAALHISYKVLDIKINENILTTPITFLSTASAAALLGAKIHFVDVNKTSGLISIPSLKEKIHDIREPIKAITPVHLAGKAVDMVAIHNLAKKNNIKIIEDASHAPLAEYSDSKGKLFKVGSCAHSDMTVISCHAIKHIAMGEGGVILTNNKNYADKAMRYRSHGIIRNPNMWIGEESNKKKFWYYEMQDIAWNYRATEMQCALGRSQLSRLDFSLKKRNSIAKFYYNYLNDFENIELNSTPHDKCLHSYHLYTILLQRNRIKKNKIQIMDELKKNGIGTQVHYIPLFFQPYYKVNYKNFPSALEYYDRSLSIPLYVQLTKSDVKIISNIIKKIIN